MNEMEEAMKKYQEAIERGEVSRQEVEKIIKADFSPEAMAQRERFRAKLKKRLRFKAQRTLPDGTVVKAWLNFPPDGKEWVGIDDGERPPKE